VSEGAPPWEARERWAAAAVFLVATLPFLRCLGHEFLGWDDGIIILGQPFLRELTLQNLWTIFSPVPAREEWLPLRDLSLALNFALGGERPWGFAAVNVALHGATAVAVLALFRALSLRRDAALLGALLFACHASHVESVAWMSGRKDSLSGLFMVLALLTWIRFRSDRGGLALPLAFYLFALLSKASAIVLPAWLLAYDVLCLRDPRWSERPWRQRIGPLLPFAVLGVVHVGVYLRSTAVDGVIEPYPPGGLLTVLRTDTVLLVDYLRYLVFPWEHQAIYDVTFRTTFADARLWLSAGVLVALSATLLSQWRRRPWLTLAGIVAATSMLPYLNLIPHGIYFAERYLYLPCIAFAGVAGAALAHLRTLPRPRSAVAVGVVMWLAVHAGLSSWRARVWKESEVFWRYQAVQLPGSPAPRMNLAEFYERSDRFADAAQIYAQLTAPPTVVPEAIFRLARVEQRRGRLEPAAALYIRYLHRKRPRTPQALNNLGSVRLVQGRHAEALRAFNAAARDFPYYLRARRNLAHTLELMGRAPEARVHWRWIVEHARLVPEQPLANEARARLSAPLPNPR
jgi:tetratricopeptide (TPR) repeat protein